jgi:hypothetical protein
VERSVRQSDGGQHPPSFTACVHNAAAPRVQVPSAHAPWTPMWRGMVTMPSGPYCGPVGAVCTASHEWPNQSPPAVSAPAASVKVATARPAARRVGNPRSACVHGAPIAPIAMGRPVAMESRPAAGMALMGWYNPAPR